MTTAYDCLNVLIKKEFKDKIFFHEIAQQKYQILGISENDRNRINTFNLDEKKYQIFHLGHLSFLEKLEQTP